MEILLVLPVLLTVLGPLLQARAQAQATATARLPPPLRLPSRVRVPTRSCPSSGTRTAVASTASSSMPLAVASLQSARASKVSLGNWEERRERVLFFLPFPFSSIPQCHHHLSFVVVCLFANPFKSCCFHHHHRLRRCCPLQRSQTHRHRRYPRPPPHHCLRPPSPHARSHPQAQHPLC